MLLASAEGQSTPAIARALRCNDQTVRNAIHDFTERGIQALQPRSSRPHTIHAQSEKVRNWLRVHNRKVKAGGKGVRIVSCLLPSKSPWLNSIEPK